MNRRPWLIGSAILLVLIAISLWKTPMRTNNVFELSQSGPIGKAMNLSADRQATMIATDEAPMMAPSTGFAPPSPREGDGSTGVIGPDSSRLMIKTAELSILVQSVELQAQGVGKAVAEKGGFIVSSQVYNLNTIPQATVTVRVPATQFDQLLSDLRTYGQVTSESINGQDVTAEYVDLDAELRNLKATEAQFLEIMKKAQKIEDILAVQRELTTTRYSIERIEGRMKYLRESAEYSTITVYLSSDAGSLPILTKGDEWKPIRVFKDALRSLADLGKGLLSTVIWGVVYAPVWIILGIIVWVVVKKIKK